MIAFRWCLPALAATTALLAACASTSQANLYVPPNGPIPAANIPASVASREALAKVACGTTVPLTGNPDQDFAAQMVPHDQAAIQMAELELQYGHDPVMRRLARRMLQHEANTKYDLDAWLQNHPVPETMTASR
jgi:uncharacterized protein (DUF305 family)